MTDPTRLGVLFTPSPLETAWRAALTEQAARAGWQVVEAIAGHEPAGSPAGRTLILSQDAAALTAWDPDARVVVADTPDAAGLFVARVMGEEALHIHSLIHTAQRLAAASALASAGATVLNARRPSLALPGLGDVPWSGEPAPRVAAGTDRPLSHYDALPVPVGATVEWTPAWFKYPIKDQYEGGSPVVDMTGRVRGLLHGPYADLPPGVWRADIRVSVDPEGGHAHLRFEWGTGQEFVASNVEITAPGIYEMPLIRAWTEQSAAQARVWIPQPLFQGRMEFLGCRVTRVADDTPETTGR